MRILKLGLISIVILFLLITFISLLVPSHVRISKAVNIHINCDNVWQQIDDLGRWEQWNPLFNNLTSKKVEYLDTTDGILNAIKVETTIIKWKEKNEDEHIAEMKNADRNAVISGWKCIKYNNADSITLQWYMDFKLKWYPWEKFGSLLFESTYGSQMEKGLENLKNLLEK